MFSNWSSVYPRAYKNVSIWATARTDYAVAPSAANVLDFSIDMHYCAYHNITKPILQASELLTLNYTTFVNRYGTRTPQQAAPVTVSLISGKHFTSSDEIRCPL